MLLMKRIIYGFLVFYSLMGFAQTTDTTLAVWANEAIVATYTFNHQNFMARQKEIAKYFTAEGWMAYSTALNDSKLPEAVEKNAYYVSAVAIMPPEIKTLRPNRWQAKMPLLVVYKNPQYAQKQTLEVTIQFISTSAGKGVRGLAITSLTSKIIEPPCTCSNLNQDQTPPATKSSNVPK